MNKIITLLLFLPAALWAKETGSNDHWSHSMLTIYMAAGVLFLVVNGFLWWMYLADKRYLKNNHSLLTGNKVDIPQSLKIQNKKI
jgi:hypothetical protein